MLQILQSSFELSQTILANDVNSQMSNCADMLFRWADTVKHFSIGIRRRYGTHYSRSTGQAFSVSAAGAEVVGSEERDARRVKHIGAGSRNKALTRDKRRSVDRTDQLPYGRLHGMYGPPLRRKRKVRVSQVGLRKCIRPSLEWITPGHDGMRCALFPISYSVSRDFFRVRVLRAPGSIVVPSPYSPADLTGNHVLRSGR
jgi:hypothetical protein